MTFTHVVQTQPWHVAGWTMLHFVWVGGALGLAAALGRRMLRSAPPEIRYGYALVCLVAMAIAPGAIALVQIASDQSAEAPAETVVQAQSPSRHAMPALPDQTPDLTEPRTAGTANVVPVSASSFQVPAVAEMLDTLANALPWIWVTGSPLTFGLLATGFVGVERFRREARLLRDGEIPEIARRLSAMLRIARPVALAVCHRVTGPMLVGVIRPLILLPPAVLTGWSTDQIEMALLHELAHVRRHDNLINLVQHVIESLLFFHPAVWWVSGWVRLEREHCCDQLVVTHTGQARPYAEMLAALVAPESLYRYGAVAMAERPVVARIRRILNLEDHPMPIPRVAIALATVSFAVPAILIVARASDSDAPKPTQTAVERAKLDDLFQKVRRGADMFKDVQGRAYALKNIAVARAALGDRAAARQAFQEAIALGETVRLEESTYDGHILSWIAQSQAKAGFRDDAIETYRKLRRIVDETGNAKGQLPSSLEHDTSNGSALRVDFEKISQYENILAAQRELGDIVEARKTFELGRGYLIELQKHDSWYNVATVSLAKLQARSGDVRGALHLIDDPDRGKIKDSRALIVIRANGLNELLATIEPTNNKDSELILNAMRRELDTIQGLTPFETRLIRSQHLRGITQALSRLGRFQEALAAASKIEVRSSAGIADEAPNESRFNNELFAKAEAFVTISEAQLKAGDQAGAQASARQSVAVSNESQQNEYLINRAATVLARTGETAEARKIADSLRPAYRVEAYQAIAGARREAGDAKEAEAILRDALKLAQSQIPASKPIDRSHLGELDQLERHRSLEQVAHCQALLGDVNAAIATAEKIRVHDRRTNALRRIATDRAEAHDLDGALEVINSINGAKDQAEARLSVMTAYSGPH